MNQSPFDIGRIASDDACRQSAAARDELPLFVRDPDEPPAAFVSGIINADKVTDTLADRLTAALAAHSGLFVVTGAMGIGKTAFAAHMARALTQLGYAVVHSQPSEALLPQLALLRDAPTGTSPILLRDDAHALSDDDLLHLADVFRRDDARVVLIGRPLLRERLFQAPLAPLKEHVRYWDRMRPADRPAAFVPAPIVAEAPAAPPAAALTPDIAPAAAVEVRPHLPTPREDEAQPEARPFLVATDPAVLPSDDTETRPGVAKGLALLAASLLVIAVPQALEEPAVPSAVSAPVVADIAVPEPLPAAEPAETAPAPEATPPEPTIADLLRALPPPTADAARAAEKPRPRPAHRPRATQHSPSSAAIALPAPPSAADPAQIVAAAPAPHCEPYTAHDTYIGSETAIVRGTACRDAAGTWWLVNRVSE